MKKVQIRQNHNRSIFYSYVKTTAQFTVVALVTAFAIGCRSTESLIWKQEGEIRIDSPEWSFTPSENKGNLTFYADEGYYLDRGGKLSGPQIEISDGEYNFFSYSFDSKSSVRCYWALDFFRSNGERIKGDVYASVHPSRERVSNRCIFYGRNAMAAVKPFFRSLEPLHIWNPRIAKISVETAVEWCDDLYEKLPKLTYAPPENRLQYLPKTMAALKNGKPWTLLILGHSLFNDTYNSNFMALLKRLYPKSNLKVIWSGRGGTGCDHYKNHIEEYVLDYNPDLVIVGGVSRSNDIGDIASVINQLQEKLGCEMMLMTPPFGIDPRKHQAGNHETPLPKQKIVQDKRSKSAFIEAQQKLAAEEKIAFMDGTTIWLDYLGASGKPWQWFNRDKAHANDRGKQIIARVFERYFDGPTN